MAERVDVLVVGAGPAGCAAARAAAAEGAQVLLVERRPTIGLPVQCAEYVPLQIAGQVSLPEHCIARRIRTLHTHLPGGEVVETPAAGYVLDRALFDKALATAACRAGARVWVAARAMERTGEGVLVRRGGRAVEVRCRVVVGADGPRSTVGRWVGQANDTFIDALQVEVALPEPPESTQIYFDPAFPGGYGWLFPKRSTANVGAGVNRGMGGDPREALGHLLDRLEIGEGEIVGRTGGPVPSGGPVDRLCLDGVLLVGDAAGHTHPITGAGIAPAVIGGELAGRAAAQAIASGDAAALDGYAREWDAFMEGSLRHALSRRRRLDEGWSDDPAALEEAVRENWIAFRAYGRRTARERQSP